MYTRKQPNSAILSIGRNAKSTRLATMRSRKRTAGLLSSCDKWQKVTSPVLNACQDEGPKTPDPLLPDDI